MEIKGDYIREDKWNFPPRAGDNILNETQLWKKRWKLRNLRQNLSQKKKGGAEFSQV